MTSFYIHVLGTPRPKGSMRAVTRHRRILVVSDNSKLKQWQETISDEVRINLREMGYQDPPFGKHVPVRVDLVFSFLRPKGVPASRVHHVVKPDLDKLQRAVFDALSGIAYEDDAQVVMVGDPRKQYGPVEGVEITVSAVK